MVNIEISVILLYVRSRKVSSVKPDNIDISEMYAQPLKPKVFRFVKFERLEIFVIGLPGRCKTSNVVSDVVLPTKSRQFNYVSNCSNCIGLTYPNAECLRFLL